MNRRQIIKRVSAAMLAAGLPFTGRASAERRSMAEIRTILFQGDSITDAGRNKERQDPNTPHGLGNGYAMLSAADFLTNYPGKELTFHNRGISGHKVFQLQERWEEDALALEPDMISILIGVNDYWHTLSHDYKGTVKTYETDFRELLETTLDRLPDVQLIICEPFFVAGGTAITDVWKEEFPPYQEASLQLAKEFNTGYVPFQAWFDKALEEAPVSYWCPDGVHPSLAGSQLMARAWRETAERM